jgi:adenosine/AMP kinase
MYPDCLYNSAKKWKDLDTANTGTARADNVIFAKKADEDSPLGVIDEVAPKELVAGGT